MASSGARFARSEPRQRMRRCLEGFPRPVERKNGRQLAESAWEATPYGMQRLLAGAHWYADALLHGTTRDPASRVAQEWRSGEIGRA